MIDTVSTPVVIHALDVLTISVQSFIVYRVAGTDLNEKMWSQITNKRCLLPSWTNTAIIQPLLVVVALNGYRYFNVMSQMFSSLVLLLGDNHVYIKTENVFK